MATTPTTEPASIVAGDTIAWTKSFPDYPATTWTLKYRLLNSAAKIDITASTSGSDYSVAATAAVTAAYAAGKYDYTAWVEKGSGPTAERVTVGQGRITVVANLAIQTTYDNRSECRKIYEALLAAYQARITAGQGFVTEYEIAGRRMKFSSSADWITQLNYWKSQVAAEDRATAIATGMGSGARVLVRF